VEGKNEDQLDHQTMSIERMKQQIVAMGGGGFSGGSERAGANAYSVSLEGDTVREKRLEPLFLG
jgi:hypothetical protein